MSAKPNIIVKVENGELLLDAERDGHTVGVALKLPAEPKDISAACSALIMLLAGTTEAELFMAATNVMFPELAA